MSIKKKFNLGIIGAGYMAAKYLEIIKHDPQMHVSCITSRTIKRAESLAKKYKISSINKNLEDLIKNNKCDGLLILVSVDEIFNVTKKVIKYRIPFLLEKPPGLSVAETKILSNLTTKKKIPNMVGLNRRYYSIFKKGIDIIKKNGKLLGISIEGHERFWNVESNYNKKIKNAWIYANSIHTIDLLRFFGGEVKKIFSTKKRNIQKNGDQFISIIEFKNGVLGSYISHWYSPGGWSIRLFGEGVSVIFEPLEQGYIINKNFKKKKILPSKYDKRFKVGLYDQIQSFKKLISTKKINWPTQDLAEVLKTMNLIKKISSND